MKKYIKFAALALVVALASCDSEADGTDFVEVGGNAVPQATISRLDRNFNLPIALFTKEGVTATKVEIYQNIAATTADPIKLGPKVADATIADGTATFNTSTLGSFDVFPVTQTDGTVVNNGKTGVLVLAILTTYSDGSSTRAPYRLTVAKGIVWKADDHGSATTTTTATSGVSAVLYDNPAPVVIHYATVKNTGTVIDNVVGEWSFDDGETFTAIPNLTFSTSKQTIDLAALDYKGAGVQPDDEVIFRFTVTAGTQTDAITTKIVYADQVFDGAKDGVLSNSDTTSHFSFTTGLNYDGAENTNSEIIFTEDFGFEKASNNNRIEFVDGSGLNWASTNLLQAQAAFNSGTKVQSFNNLVVNNLVLYKITRNLNLGTDDEPDFQDVTFYGLIKITDRTAGTTSQKLSFSYKEGVLYLETPTTPVVLPTDKK